MKEQLKSILCIFGTLSNLKYINLVRTNYKYQWVKNVSFTQKWVNKVKGFGHPSKLEFENFKNIFENFF